MSAPSGTRAARIPHPGAWSDGARPSRRARGPEVVRVREGDHPGSGAGSETMRVSVVSRRRPSRRRRAPPRRRTRGDRYPSAQAGHAVSGAPPWAGSKHAAVPGSLEFAAPRRPSALHASAFRPESAWGSSATFPRRFRAERRLSSRRGKGRGEGRFMGGRVPSKNERVRRAAIPAVWP